MARGCSGRQPHQFRRTFSLKGCVIDLGINTSIGVVTVELQGVTDAAYNQAQLLLDQALKNPGTKNRDAIRSAFLYLVRDCPEANVSDLWHHIVYRQYC